MELFRRPDPCLQFDDTLAGHLAAPSSAFQYRPVSSSVFASFPTLATLLQE